MGKNYKDYYQAREQIIDIISKDLLGPVSDREIICNERPLEYYILGKLYPQNDNASMIQHCSADDCGNLESEADIPLNNSNNPSSFGISFAVNSAVKSLTVQTEAAKYNLISLEEAKERVDFSNRKYNEQTSFWERCPLHFADFQINIGQLCSEIKQNVYLEENLLLQVFLHKVYDDGTKTITITMINTNTASNNYKEDCLHAYFQPKITVKANEAKTFVDVRRNVRLSQNPELRELDMLYSRVSDFASGHGCAVNWCIEEGTVSSIYTTFVPMFEILQMKPASCFNGRVLEMKYLGTMLEQEVRDGLNTFVNAYDKWIETLESSILNLPEEYHKPAQTNVKKCRETLNTLRRSIESLADPVVYKAFALANLAMFTQRKQMLLNIKQFTADEDIKWYPFQLAFILQEIISFSDEHSDEHKKVDLLWFPTGGGKTEAYLGISAFVIFLRRLRYLKKGNGVTVLMRYTLRLLSFQQFERAALLICACELLRKKYQIPGDEIGVGLWAGKALTPNTIEKAQNILNGISDPDAESSNPAQIEKCPWCGSTIKKSDYHCDLVHKRMLIKCSNPKCDFCGGLPIYLIDEEIYAHTPAFIVSTVDKFAQLALNQDTTTLFGSQNHCIPPQLIIQDELHLISGPLGTITGVYEAAIRRLCSYNGVPPKVIASTATIRNAKEQIRSLYASEYTQFPPQGIDINDSFFAELSARNEKPARMYLGCMAVGTSPTTMMIRVMSSLLFATRYLTELGYDEKVIDSFWTITGYFNTLRELGGAIVRVIDDIQDRFTYLRNTKFKDSYPLSTARSRFDHYKELTSREKSENIGNVIQNELKIPYRKDGTTDPFDFLLSSNMISVGVDVGRLGTMVVVGQPKTTSEYIQATSRVGRETPGLVIATYNQNKSRDRSHYEDFTQYHACFYKYVEATSVTPFSDRARDRTMQALYVILCRNLIDELKGDQGANNFDRNLSGLEEIRQYILNYVDAVDPDEHDNVVQDINEIETIWEEKVNANRKGPLKYRRTKYMGPNDALFDPDYLEDSRFRVLNTMRSVETTIRVVTNDGKERN